MSNAPTSEPIGGGARANSIPVLGEGFAEQPESISESVSHSTQSTSPASDPQSPEQDSHTQRRRFWGLGRTKDAPPSTSPSRAPIPSAGTRDFAPRNGTQTPSPSRQPGPFATSSPSSPARMRSPSPASSQIFERNVQEDGLLLAASNPSAATAAIPAHITTENHIPPALSASANAFADERLSPDRVEIVTLASHQPAAASVTGAVGSDLADSTASLPAVEPHDQHHNHALAATHHPHHHAHHPHLHALGSPALQSPTHPPQSPSSLPPSLDSTDIRRLSFISFADVVHDEHVATTTDAAQRLSASAGVGSSFLSSSSSSPPLQPPRSPSPVASPGASELSVETMRQALRKTGSGDWETRELAVDDAEGTSGT